MSNIFAHAGATIQCYSCHMPIRKDQYVNQKPCGHIYHHSCEQEDCLACIGFELEIKIQNNKYNIFMKKNDSVLALFQWLFRLEEIIEDRVFLSMNHHTYSTTEPYNYLSNIKLDSICEENQINVCLVNRLT